MFSAMRLQLSLVKHQPASGMARWLPTVREWRKVGLNKPHVFRDFTTVSILMTMVLILLCLLEVPLLKSTHSSRSIKVMGFKTN
jgi:hypothetical protein